MDEPDDCFVNEQETLEWAPGEQEKARKGLRVGPLGPPLPTPPPDPADVWDDGYQAAAEDYADWSRTANPYRREPEEDAADYIPSDHPSVVWWKAKMAANYAEIVARQERYKK